ncbi:hypothetical protein R3Q15_16105 [Gordonia amicalis]|uniref:Mce-associated membrane protein n=1 Tax=Gordonia amicalis TaxID=89053 RepID=A0AAE4UAE9_9ACTN|nr:hypothetical protein [Gordonia amicalis]MDV6313398.1 hypothetical protein [Gordonia amicalis]
MAPTPNQPPRKRRPTPKVAGHTRAARSDADEVATESGVSLSKSDDAEVSVPAEERGAETPGLEGAEPTPPTTRTRPVSRVSTLRPSGTQTGADGPSSTGSGPSRPAPERGPAKKRNPLLLTAMLAGVAVLLGIAAVILAFRPGLGENRAFVDQSATTELIGQSQEQICAVWGHEHTDLGGWAKRAQNALTGDARKEFDESLKTQRDLITQTKSGAECRVDAVGVTNLSGAGDGARATVIANLIISETQNSIATNSLAPRVQFAMVKEGDTWRIQGVEPF